MNTPNDQLSRWWFAGPPVVILVTIFVYYAKFASVRDWVDTRFPWVAENVGSHLTPLVVNLPPPPKPSPMKRATPPPMQPGPTPAPAAQPDAQHKLFASAAEASFVGPHGEVDMARLAMQPAAWPKSLTLKKTAEFPAVVNGKTVGKISAPPGTETRLVTIKEGKLGLEWQGGGGWFAPEDTDLAARLAH